MTMNCFPIQWRRTLILSAAVAFAACSSSSTTNDAQIAGGSGGTTSAGSGGASAHLDAAVASTGGSTGSGAGGSTTSGGGSTGTSNTGVDAAQADRPATDGTQADAPIRDSQAAGVGGEAGGSTGAGGSGAATMFLSDGISGAVYRYTLRPGADPVLNYTITVTAPGGTGNQQTATGLAMSPAGELFVANFSTGVVFRFTSPLGTPTANGSVVVTGIGNVEEIRFVDDELWVPNVTPAGSTTPESIVRVGFDTQGIPSVAGSLMTYLVGARGMLWVPATRDLYVSQCHPVDAIQHYRVGTDHTATALTPITGNGINNPHGMVVTPWGELLVSNPGEGTSATLLRFTVDAQGNIAPNGVISGNGLDASIGLAFTPWGELFAINQATATISRFTFDSAHAAVANGTCSITGPTVALQAGLGWILIVPGASSAVDGGAMDSATGTPSDAASD